MKKKKYELIEDDFILHKGRILYRIRALMEIPNTVSEGELGGYVERYHNLSQEGECWVSNNAKVYGNARIEDNAEVVDDAEVYGNAVIKDDAFVEDTAEVFGNAVVRGSAFIYMKSKVYNNAIVKGDARVYDNSQVYDNALIEDVGIGVSRIYDNAVLISYEVYYKVNIGDNTKEINEEDEEEKI